MTNIYDVLGKLHVKATGSVTQSVEEDLQKEDPPKEEAKAVLKASIPLETTGIFKGSLKTKSEPESEVDSTERDEEE